MTELSFLISQLVTKGWPRDYSNANASCWYVRALDDPFAPLDDPDYAPDLTGREGCLMIHPPPGRYFISVHVHVAGNLGYGAVDVHKGQGPLEDGFAGCFENYRRPRLQHLLDRAHRLYLEWELKQLGQEKTLAQLEEQLKQELFLKKLTPGDC